MLRTKLHRPPAIFNEQVIRSGLIEKLESGLQKPMSLVSAPAGYGKSQTVSQWLQETTATSCWISLDEEDNDLRVFLTYVVAALHTAVPNSVPLTETISTAGELPPIKTIAHTLINELDEIDKTVILVLDDYHRIKENSIHELIDELLVYPPQCLHLCIVTRRDPPLKLNRLLAQSRMVEVRMKHLAFSTAEIKELYQNLFNESINEETANSLKNRTEGWIVGLRLASLLTTHAASANHVFTEFTGDLYALSQYMLEEILDKQPAEFQEVLLRVSLLDKFNAELVSALLKVTVKKAQSFIDWLQEINLFIIPLDQQNNWFRFHHLIQEFLQRMASKRIMEDDLVDIHTSAAIWFERNEFIEDAIRHMLKAQKVAEVSKIIIRNRLSELYKDKWYVVQRWLSKLPQTEMNEPNLLLSACWPAYENIQFELLGSLLQQAELLLKNNQDSALHGEWNLVSGLLQFWSGNCDQAMTHFEQAKVLLPEEENLFTGMLNLHIAMARTVSGKTELAITELKQQIQQSEGNAVYETRLYSGLYYNNMFAGNLAQAKRYGNKVKSIGAENDLHYTHAMGVCQEAMACFCANQLEAAIVLLKIAEQKRFILHKGTAIDAMVAKVIAYEIQNQPKEADTTLKTLKAFTTELNQDAYTIVSSSCEMRLLSMRNELEKAMEWQSLLEQTPIFAGLFIWIEVPRLTQVRVLLRESSEKSLDKAAMILAEVNEIAKRYYLINQQIEVAVLKVVLLIKRGILTEAAKALDTALQLSEPGHWIRPYLEWKSELYPLIAEVCSDNGVPYFYKLLLESLNKSMGTKTNELAVQAKPVEVATDNAEQLSVREIDVVRLMSQGFRNKEIADTLFISVGTVKKHIYNIGQKWQLHNRIAISRRATELSYV